MLKNLLLIIFFLAASASAATFTVTKTTDSNDGVCDADCSFREAVGAANLAATDDIVRFAIPGNQCPDLICTVRLPPDGQVYVQNNGGLTIQGNGWFRTIISITGGNSLLLVNAGNTNLVVNDLRLSGGNYPGSGALGAGFQNNGTAALNRVWIDHNTAMGCHGIFNAGVLTLNDSNVWSNSGINGGGGGICNFANYGGSGSPGVMTIKNSSVVGNAITAILPGGGSSGGIYSNGTLTIANSTISGNYAAAYGGGISQGGTMQIDNSTVSQNSASGIGGLESGGVTRTRNTLYAGNIQFGDPIYSGLHIDSMTYGTPITSLANNIIGNGSNSYYSCGFTNGVNGDSVGTSAAPILPKLAPVGLYGGNSFSQVPLTTSPVLNSGNNCVTDLSCESFNPSPALTTDQRGAARSGNVDVGAVEDNSSFVAQLPTAFINVPYNLTLVPNSGTFSYTVVAGNVPTGMTFANSFAGFTSKNDLVPQAGVALSGTPTVAGIYNFTVRISDGTDSADVNYSMPVLAPTAANVSLSGRVLTANGQGISKTRISLTNSRGETVFAATNNFGFYNFENVAAGESYVISVNHKKYVFTEPTRVLTVNDAVSNINFIAVF